MKKLYITLFLLLVSSLNLFAQTETEPNDNINQGSNSGNTFTASATTTLSIGATLTVANNDFYKINLPSCGSWAFNIINDSGQGNVNVKFYNDQSTTTALILDRNYNFDTELPKPVVINCGQTIWVQVDQTSGTNIGAYKLEVSQYTTGDTYECNNGTNTATILSNINSSFSAKLWGYDCSGNPDADYFTYTPTQCGILKIVVTNQNVASELTIDVFDDATPTKNFITSLALNGNFGALLEANKKYYFRITDATSFGDSYDLFDDPFTITTSYDTSDIYECNNTFSTAATLPIGQSFDIKLWGENSQVNLEDNRPKDADYFTYTPTQCGVLKVVVTNQNVGAELAVNVYDDATPIKNLITTLALNGNFGALLEANKKYYFRITDETSFGDSYDLFDDPFTITTSYDTSDIYECNNTFASASVSPMNTSFNIKLWGQNSQINLSDARTPDADYFTYTPTQCGVLKVVVTNQNVASELTVSLYDDATPIKNLISTLPLNGNLGALLEANKKYYFVITDATSFGDNYDLFDDAFTVTTAFYTSPVVTQVGTTYSTIQTSSSQSNTYQWYRNGVLISGANSSSYTSSLAGPYTVCISNPSSCSTCSANLSNESFEQTVLSVYPNPTSSVLKLQFDNNTAIDKVIITDMTGKKVLEQTQNNSQINVESLAKGTYIIEVSSENKKFQSKFIKE